MKKILFFLFIVSSCVAAGYSQTYNYDVNGDGYVTAADVTAIYDYLLGNVPVEPPVDHEYVDLGLPSGTLWATMNVGATCPEDYGDYFAWGETTPKDWYDYVNGYIHNKIELEPEGDAATANWGSEWCMPSLEQIQELIANCTSQWTMRNGVAGRSLISNINGASLFLPAAGHRYEYSLFQDGECGSYWTRTFDECLMEAYCLEFSSSENDMGCGTRRGKYGFTVRAVRVSQK